MMFSKLFNFGYFIVSNKTSGSSHVCFGLFSSAMFISGGGIVATRKRIPEIGTSFLVPFFWYWYLGPFSWSLSGHM